MKPFNILLVLITIPISFILWVLGATFLTTGTLILSVGMLIDKLSKYLSYKIYGE